MFHKKDVVLKPKTTKNMSKYKRPIVLIVNENDKEKKRSLKLRNKNYNVFLGIKILRLLKTFRC